MKWLRTVNITKDAPVFNHMIRFLTAIGANDHEDLEALATSFDEIVAVIGS